MWYTPANFMGRIPDQSGEITELLHRWRDGNAEAERQLFEIVMPHLRRLAHYLMKRERKDHSLQATELVGEAYFVGAGCHFESRRRGGPWIGATLLRSKHRTQYRTRQIPGVVQAVDYNRLYSLSLYRKSTTRQRMDDGQANS